MTFRERLADWISGGALSEARRQRAAQEERAEMWCNRAVDNGQMGMKYLQRCERIAAEERPTSNATVKRMARIARGEE